MEFKLLQKKAALSNTRLSITPTRTREIIPREVLSYLSKSPTISNNTSFQSNEMSSRLNYRNPRSHASTQQSKGLLRTESNKEDVIYGREEETNHYSQGNVRRPLQHLQPQNKNLDIEEANLDRSRQNWKLMKHHVNGVGSKHAKSVSKSPNKFERRYTEDDVDNLLSVFHANKTKSGGIDAADYRSAQVDWRQKSRESTDNLGKRINTETRNKAMDYANMIKEIAMKAQGTRNTSQDRSLSPNLRSLETRSKSPCVRDRKQTYLDPTSSSTNKKKTTKSKENQPNHIKGQKEVPIFKENLRDFAALQSGKMIPNREPEVQEPKIRKKSMIDLSHAHLRNRTSMHAIKYPDRSESSSKTSFTDSRNNTIYRDGASSSNPSYPSRTSEQTESQEILVKALIHKERDALAPSRASVQTESYDHPIRSSLYDSRNTSLTSVQAKVENLVDLNALSKLLKLEFSRINQNENNLKDQIQNNSMQLHLDTRFSSVQRIEEEQELSKNVAVRLEPEKQTAPASYLGIPGPFPECFCTIAHNKSPISLPCSKPDLKESLENKKTLERQSSEYEDGNCLVEPSVSLGSNDGRKLRMFVAEVKRFTEEMQSDTMMQKPESVNHIDPTEQEYTPRYGYKDTARELGNRMMMSQEGSPNPLSYSGFSNSELHNLSRQLINVGNCRTEEEPIVNKDANSIQHNFNSFGNRQVQIEPVMNTETVQGRLETETYSYQPQELRYEIRPSEGRVGDPLLDSYLSKNQETVSGNSLGDSVLLSILQNKEKGRYAGQYGRETNDLKFNMRNNINVDYCEVKVTYKGDLKETILADFFKDKKM